MWIVWIISCDDKLTVQICTSKTNGLNDSQFVIASHLNVEGSGFIDKLSIPLMIYHSHKNGTKKVVEVYIIFLLSLATCHIYSAWK